MMALNTSSADRIPPASSKSSSSNTSTTTTTSSRMVSKTPLRRRKSKGTIGGFGFTSGQESISSSTSDAQKDRDPGNAASTASTATPNQPAQHASAAASGEAAPACHSTRLALMCCQNAIRMGARTQLGLCPPGRARRTLKAALKQKNTRMRKQRTPPPAVTNDYFGVDKMVVSIADYPVQEQDFLLTANTFDVESDEEASSGDEDELNDFDELMKEDSPSLDDEKKYLQLNEPLFAPAGVDPNAPPGTMPAVTTGRLPFNRRKLRYFDSVLASHRQGAREYLVQESKRSKHREVLMLSKHLKKMQKRERRRIKLERGQQLVDADMSDNEQEDDVTLPTSVNTFDRPMVPAAAAALLLESLLVNPLESLDGMAKCYDGVVAAGVALLEAGMNDPTSPSGVNERAAATRAQVVAALTPLLITSLEQPSGEALLSLARLRRMCGTPRYQRRFVQRIAPALIRPPNGALWCLKHQNDMEPILAAVELIFDNAAQIFSKGWDDRGNLLLADSKRAETLHAAAMQLRNLGGGPDDAFALGSLGGHGGGWRKSRQDAKASSERLAEWEVIAVDRQIRVSISNIISTDWSRIVLHSKDSEMAKSYHRTRASRRSSVTMHGDMSPRVATPSSPARAATKTPSSPPVPLQIPTGAASPQTEDYSFAADFSRLEAETTDRAKSPLPTTPRTHTPPLSPPAPNRSVALEDNPRFTVDQPSGQNGLFPQPVQTPPRSPIQKSPKLPTEEVPVAVHTSTPPQMSPISPLKKAAPVKESIMMPTASSTHEMPPQISPSGLSLSSSSLGSDVMSRPVSSASSSASSLGGTFPTGSHQTHYRMLTSTIAERKRTVAACRSLRSQLNRFEAAFKKLHGRLPKGAAERAPLATTYVQYREWKKVIRTDATCRIQALFRGSRERLNLLQSNDEKVIRVVKTRAGTKAFAEKIAAENSKKMMNELSLPSDIGDSIQESSVAAASAILVQGNVGPDGFLTNDSMPVAQPLPPQWGNQIVRRRSAGSPIPRQLSSPSNSVLSPNSSLSRLSLADLQESKKELKRQLKQYDVNFYRQHHRMPVKAEKEPIRNLYERYNALKGQINSMEGNGSPTSVPTQHSTSVLPQRTVSPVSATDSSGDEDSSTGRRRSSASRASSRSSAGQDLATLRSEKGRLHTMLRSYERDFFRENNRQVSSFADIRPVAQQYRRYREIKRAIAGLLNEMND